MQLLEDQLVLSASDLNNHLACRHLTALELDWARGDRTHTPKVDSAVDLIARKGDEHETAYLQSLKDQGREVVELPFPANPSLEALQDAATRTESALRAGPEVIYQATFFGDGLRGHADFLFRVERPSKLGEFSYEVADTKLAHRAKPYFILQLCFYSELLARLQGLASERIHVILGARDQHSFRLAEFSAYFRHVRDGFLAEMADPEAWDTYPDPVEHCGVCRWSDVCDARRLADDHLSLVAGMRRGYTEPLRAAGVRTLEALALATLPLEVDGIRQPVLEKLHAQASLQLRGRSNGAPCYELLAAENGRGFHRLPSPSQGDIYFDIEGDPFFENGLEYLWGVVTTDTGSPEFGPIWGRNRAEEKRALERFTDYVIERRRSFPDLHVYHYAHYEITALKRLAGMHATREEELDQLLRDQVFVDLYRVVVEGLRISEPSYGLKKVEAFFMEERETEVTDGNDSVVEFERWLETGEEEILDRIADYNRDDCVSTWLLHKWLLERRKEAEREFGAEMPWFEPEPGERGVERLAHREKNEALIRTLLEGLPDNLAEAGEAERARWLMAQLLEYHHREARPVWWAFFDRCEAEPDQLVDDADCVGGLTQDESIAPRPEKQSLLYRLQFPPQETKLGAGGEAVDPATGANPGGVFAIDVEGGWLDLKRGRTKQDDPLPKALIPGGPYRTNEQQDALRRLAKDLLEDGPGADGTYPAARQILLRSHPRVAGRSAGDAIDHPTMSIEELSEVVAGLEESYLFLQGPPGSGKTFRGARVIVDLIGRGKRVGVTSTSHKAIHNLLDEIESVAEERGVRFKGRKKHSDNPDSEFESKLAKPLVESVDNNGALSDPAVALTGGTAWHYCREDTARLDYLFIDEAGQISLADALALATAARNVVLLGDPQQLPQVAQAAHPGGSEQSVLEHLLGDRQTIPPERGIFLEDTYRLHPEIAAFVSELMYDGRLGSAEGCERQRVEAAGEIADTGLRWLPVEHEGCQQSSPAEADRIAEAVAPLLAGGTYIDSEGKRHELRPEDVMIATPYNAQVRCLRERLPDGVRVGTVDKIQGQEAQVVFFSMATSSGEDIPRNVEFLLSRNRVNVAVSRARCLAVLVASPRLLDISANSIEQMRLVNALCRFVEVAGKVW